MSKFKCNEDKLIKELFDYVSSTYDGHYSFNKFQSIEFIADSGHGDGFCLGNVIKYAQRYGRKGDVNEQRKDLLKIAHYAIIALYNHDIKNINEGELDNEDQ